MRLVLEGKLSAHFPSPSPVGPFIAFEDAREDTATTSENEGNGHEIAPNYRTYVFDSSTGEALPLGTRSLSSCQWFPDGERLACIADDAIFVAGVDGRESQITGIPEEAHIYAFGLAPDGDRLVYLEVGSGGPEPSDVQVYRVDVDGSDLLQLGTIPDVEYCASVQWSSDGKEVLVAVSHTPGAFTSDLYLVAVEEGGVRWLFHSEHFIFVTPRWMTGDQHIFFIEYNRQRDVNTFFVVDRNGATQTFEVEGLESGIFAGDFSPDQTKFAFALMYGRETDPGGLYVADLESEYWLQVFTDYQINSIETLTSGIPP